jgi:AcrR family transcriptional regulator
MPMLREGGSRSRRREPRQPRAKLTVESIKIAAVEIARDKGFAALNTIDIAARAGISVGSLYEYFRNRESILLSIYEDTTEQFVSSIKARLPQILEAPLQKAVRRTAAELFNSYRKNQMILVELPQQMPELRLSGHAVSFDQLMHGSLRLFLVHHRRGESPALIERRAFFIESILIGSIQRYLSRPPARLSVAAFLDHVTTIVVDYIERPMS